MKRIIVICLVLGFLLLPTAGLPPAASASDTVAAIDWQLSSVTDLQNNSYALLRSVLSLDVDLGFTFINMYGSFCSPDGIDCAAASGSGYLYQAAGGVEIHMDVRSGSKMYRIILNAATLSGTCAIYDYTGSLEAAGSIDFLSMY
ncbi:MAG: hypothetical protein JW781_05605 [Deltaproteobacteria bacterium]|nr:hypothetical protein [Candidatus Anaeroferrophillacea bacterium]